MIQSTLHYTPDRSFRAVTKYVSCNEGGRRRRGQRSGGGGGGKRLSGIKFIFLLTSHWIPKKKSHHPFCWEFTSEAKGGERERNLI